MESLKGHEDFQVCDDDGNLSAYVAKYVPKMSDSFTDDLLNDDAGGDVIAASVLARYKPYEPEMVLQLFGAKFRQWHVNTKSGGKRDFIVPVPDQQDMPPEVRQYEMCDWKGSQMTLLDFLRKTNADGEIIGWLRRKFEHYVIKEAYALYTSRGGQLKRDKFVTAVSCVRKADPGKPPFWDAALAFMEIPGGEDVTQPIPLKDFARCYDMRGEKIVAAHMLSRLNDKFHGQWLMLHVPFARATDFRSHDVDERVPEAHRYLAMALVCQHRVAKNMWLDETAIDDEMKMEAHTKAHRQTVINQFRAQAAMVRQYLDGTLDKTAPGAAAAATAAAPPAQPLRRRHALPIQRRYERMIAEGTKTVEGRINVGAAAKVREGDELRLGTTTSLVQHIFTFPSFSAMLREVGVERALPDVDNVRDGLDVYHGFKNYESLARQHGVVAFVLGPLPASTVVTQRPDALNTQQMRFEAALNADVDRALAVLNARNEAEADEARQACWENNKIQVCEGPPGTGKSTVLFLCIERTLVAGGKVLLVSLSAQFASRMREKYGRAVDIDTCHAALGFDQPPEQAAYAMAPYALVAIDEHSQLSDGHFEHVVALRTFVDRVPAVTLLGDRFQMAGMGTGRPWHSPVWKKACFITKLVIPYRCKDPAYQRILNGIRTARPMERKSGKGVSVTQLMRGGRRAWRGAKPTVSAIRALLLAHPNTTMMAVSRRGAAELNDLAVTAKFPRRAPLATLPGDVEANPDNYEHGKLKNDARLKPLSLPIHQDMKVYLTRNVRKDVDFVNGMLATVEEFDEASRGLRVITATGYRVAVFRWTDVDHGNISYYPVRPGYASTVAKFQGAELEHVTLYLDARAPGAAYTAMSRVQYGNQCLIGGNVDSSYFAPAL